MISEEEKDAIEQCKLLLSGNIYLHIIDEDDGGTAYAGIVNKVYNKDLEIVLNLIEKQQKVANLQEKTIQLMAELIFNHSNSFEWWENGIDIDNLEQQIEYFRNKAKESE